MNTTTKKVRAEVTGPEVIYRTRTVILEVPADMPTEEVERVDAAHFQDIEERTDWETTDCDGIFVEGHPEVIGDAADDEEPDVFVDRDEDGEYRVRPNPKFV